MKDNEILPKNIRIAFKTIVFISILIAAALVVIATYTDLYVPGSTDARTIADSAKVWMFICVMFSVPLWIEKGIAIKKWVTHIDLITDESQKRSEIWTASKPIVKQVCIILGLFIICNIWLAVFNPIPPEIASNYIEYYSRGFP